MKLIRIRQERETDKSAIHHVVESAFGRSSEARLVDTLRLHGRSVLSLVALSAGTVVGHIMFSSVAIAGEERASAITRLGPVAVLPGYQGGGIGGRLIHAGFTVLQEKGWHLVVVLGEPAYFSRFGFSPARLLRLNCAQGIPEGFFMARRLIDCPEKTGEGIVLYGPEFTNL